MRETSGEWKKKGGNEENKGLMEGRMRGKKRGNQGRNGAFLVVFWGERQREIPNLPPFKS